MPKRKQSNKKITIGSLVEGPFGPLPPKRKGGPKRRKKTVVRGVVVRRDPMKETNYLVRFDGRRDSDLVSVPFNKVTVIREDAPLQIRRIQDLPVPPRPAHPSTAPAQTSTTSTEATSNTPTEIGVSSMQILIDSSITSAYEYDRRDTAEPIRAYTNEELDWILKYEHAAAAERADKTIAHLVGETSQGWAVVEDSSVVSDNLITNPQNSLPSFSVEGTSRGLSDAKLIKFFMKLYPGDIVKHVDQLNLFANYYEDDCWINATVSEFVRLIGILLARPFMPYKSEKECFYGAETNDDAEGNCSDVFRSTLNILFKKFMPRRRFLVIKKYFHFAFGDFNVCDGMINPSTVFEEVNKNPWGMIQPLITAWNLNRRGTVAQSREVALDESMIAWRPRTTETGIPFPVVPKSLSYLPRKPEPLGIELKGVWCTNTGILIRLECVVGKEFNATLPLVKDFATKPVARRRNRNGYAYDYYEGGTKKALVVRFGNMLPHGAVILGDADFASAPAAAALMKYSEVYFIGHVKQQIQGYPAAFIDETLTEHPSGSKIVLEKKVDGIDLVAIGYKYNRSKVLKFIMSKGACSSTPHPDWNHIIRYCDKHGPSARTIPRPEACGHYFARAGTGDLHNQFRQGELGIYRAWPVRNIWFRATAEILAGMLPTDCYLAACYIDPQVKKRYTFRTFARMLASALCNYTDPSDTVVDEPDETLHAQTRAHRAVLAEISMRHETRRNTGALQSTFQKIISGPVKANERRACVVCLKTRFRVNKLRRERGESKFTDRCRSWTVCPFCNVHVHRDNDPHAFTGRTCIRPTCWLTHLKDDHPQLRADALCEFASLARS